MSSNEVFQKLIDHEIAYFEFGAELQITDAYVAMYYEKLPNYRDCNRLLRLRDAGIGPAKTIDLCLDWFRCSGRRVVVDIDYIAEEQGLGAELRSRGVLPVADNFICLKLSELYPFISNNSDVQIVEIDKNSQLADIWVWLNGVDEISELEAEFWRSVALRELEHPRCQLFLAFLNHQVVGACSLFSSNGWSRIDSVIVHPRFRRIGVGTKLVSEVSMTSLRNKNHCIYLLTQMYSTAHALYRKMGFVDWFINPFRRHFGPI